MFVCVCVYTHVCMHPSTRWALLSSLRRVVSVSFDSDWRVVAWASHHAIPGYHGSWAALSYWPTERSSTLRPSDPLMPRSPLRGGTILPLQISRPRSQTSLQDLPLASRRTGASSLSWKTGRRPMPRNRPLKRLSEGELAELRRQLRDLLDRGWIQHSTQFHRRERSLSGVFTRAGWDVADLLRLPS